ncbi:MAG: DegT/DnrJ/EryC1/StrS family aminotransferase, partial [archaeon]
MIHVCEPNIGKKEFEYVKKCFDSNWISSMGPFVKEFEEKFAGFCDTKYGISATSGTTALHLAVASLGIKKGDEVIMPSFTMVATANSVIYAGAKPVLVDSEMDTWNMDVTKIEEKITKKTKAIMPVHTYGHPVDMDPLMEIAEKHGLKVIEDGAEAHGALYKGKKVGSIGDCGCFSFYANKIITTGEGGMVVTANEELSEMAHTLMNHAFSKEKHFW